MGSTDRRYASRYLYNFFRLGNALPQLDTHTRLAVADFLCSDQASPVVEQLLPELALFTGEPLSHKLEKIQAVFPDFNKEAVFPYIGECSGDFDTDAFATSFFIQPDLFIKVNEATKEPVKAAFDGEGIRFAALENNVLALPNGTKLDKVLCNTYYRVQDLSSQKTAGFFDPQKYDYWWDCCAASGGKSLLLHDLQPTIQLLVSDVRQSVLDNLVVRFQHEGLLKYQMKNLDLLIDNEQILHHYQFDGIILDAPCTGSGTWGRTPEMLTHFEQSKIRFFSDLQRKIASNVLRYLKRGKPLIYITCSVFKAENEETVQFLCEHFDLSVERMEVIAGYNHKADTMFAARLIKGGA